MIDMNTTVLIAVGGWCDWIGILAISAQLCHGARRRVRPHETDCGGDSERGTGLS